MDTTVINIKDAPIGWQSSSDYVFIGRPSKWGNPYRIGRDGTREEVIDKFRRHICRSGLDLRLLQGKILVCFCSPKACHGDVLAELAG